MTNDELLALKELAESCYVFKNTEEDKELGAKLRGQLSHNNGDFFKICIWYVPDMVNEILGLRDEVERLDGNLHGL